MDKIHDAKINRSVARSALVKVLIIALLLIAMSLLCTHAQADNSNGGATLNSSDLTLPADDLTNTSFLNFIVCGSASACSSWFSTTTPLTVALGVFNDAILFLGGLLILWTILSGIMDTAHEGTFLGKHWNNGYLPIRVGIGSAMLLPVVNGICGMQIMVIWLASSGAGLATYAWSQVVPALFTTQSTSFAVESDAAEKAALDLVRGYICLDAINASEQTTDSAGLNPEADIVTNSSTPETYTTTTTAYSPGSKNFGINFAVTTNPNSLTNFFHNTPPALCGRVLINSANQLGTSKSSGPLADATVNTALNSAINEIHDAQSSALLTMSSSASSIATNFIANGDQLSSGDTAAITAMSAAYASTVNTAVSSGLSSVLTASAGTTTTMTQGGWFLAGSWFMKTAQIQSSISGAANALPYTVDGSGKSDASFRAAIGVPLNQFDLQIGADGTLQNAPLLQSASTSAPAAGSSPSASDNSSFTGWLTGVVIDGTAKAMSSYISSKLKNLATDIIGLASSTTTNPILTMQSMGTYVLGFADFLAVISATPLIGTGFGFITGGESVALQILGASLQFGIPMIPYLLWIGGIVGWMILVIEALIGASLWALAHLHPDGDGIVGRAGQGYGLVVSLALRPILMVLGLVFALFLIVPVTTLVNKTYTSAFQIALSETDMGCVLFIAVVGTYCSLMMTVVKKCFDMVWFVPDNVLRWFAGLNQQQLGQNGQDIAKEAGDGGASLNRSLAPNLSAGISQSAITAKRAPGGAIRQSRKIYQKLTGQPDNPAGTGGDDNGGGGGGAGSGSPEHLISKETPRRSTGPTAGGLAAAQMSSERKAAESAYRSALAAYDESKARSPIGRSTSAERAADKTNELEKQQGEWKRTPEGQESAMLREKRDMARQALDGIKAAEAPKPAPAASSTVDSSAHAPASISIEASATKASSNVTTDSASLAVAPSIGVRDEFETEGS